MSVQITDLIDPNEIDKLTQLDAELLKVLETYTKVAKALAKGLEISVNAVGDIDKLEKVLTDKGKEAANVQQQLTQVIEEQGKVIANTTNTISRHLMEQERVNKTQREAYTEHERVKKLLEKYHDTYDGQIQRLAQLKVQLDANKKEQKELEKALSSGKVTTEQYTAKQAELIARHRELSQEKRTLNQVMTAEEKMAQMQEGSYAHMSQQLELLKKAYKDMSQESRDSDFGKELESSIQNLDAHLKDMAADMGEFQRNVGNYAIANNSLKKEYDNLVGTLAALQTEYDKLSESEKASDEGQKLAKNIDDVTTAAKDAKTALDNQSKAVEAARQSLGETSQTTASVKKDLKELVLEIANLSMEYQNLSDEEKASAEGQALAEHIRDLTEKAGALKDAISDTNAAITNAASDTRTFDQLSGSIQLAIDGFGLAKGAAAMLGISEEELAKIQTQLQAAIAASNAMQSIQNTLQEQSAVMQGANLIQTKLRTVAENLHTAAQGKGVIATKALTVAQWAFNAAATANPIGLIVVLITACIAAIYGLIRAFTSFFGTSDESIKNYEKQKKAVENLKASHDRLIERLKAKGATEAELQKQSLLYKEEEKKAADALFARAKELYDEDDDEYKDALEAKKKADQEFADEKEKSINYLLSLGYDAEKKHQEQTLGTYKYKRKIIKEELEKQKELAAVLLEQGRITQEVYEKIVESVEKAAEVKTKEVDKEESKKNAADAKKRADELKKAVQAGEDALLNIITDSLERQRKAEELSYNRRLKELQDKLAKTKATAVTMRKAINNQIQGLMADHNNKMAKLQIEGMERRNSVEANLITSHLSAVKKNTDEELEWTLKSLENKRKAEHIALQKAVNEKTYTEEEAAEIRRNIAIKYANLIEKAEESHAAKMVELAEKRFANEQSVKDNAYISGMAALKMKYAKELEAAKGNTAKQTDITKKFEEEQIKLSEEYAKQTAQASIQMLEEVLKNNKLSAEERLKYEKALAKAKTDLETTIANNTIAQIKRTTEADNAASEKRKANAQQWLQIAADSLNAINDLVSSVYDAKISKVEEEQEANTAAGDAEIERITELVEKKVITEEEGEARKRAAEAQTAKKNDELEKKKQQLKHKQAVWDKANSIAQAGIATALAITRALPNVVLAAIAGAMGAVQIATILATPIPKYAKGTDRHKGGPAIVGDGGVPELVIFGGKSWITPDKPTVVDLPAGAVVKPNIDGIDDNTPSIIPLPMSDDNNTPVIINNDYKRLEEKMDKFIFIMRRHSNRQYSNFITNSKFRYNSDRT